MKRSVGLGLLFTLAGPFVLAAQGVPAAPAALKVDSLAQAANAAAAANSVAINFVWTLITGFLVMFMQAGFAMVETGFTRGKNAAHTFAMNFMVYGIGMLAYWAIGFALQAGGLGPMTTLGGFDKLSNEFALHFGGKTWGLFGHTGFFLSGVAYAAPVFTYFLFQMVFMDTAATIPTGAMAERWKFSAFAVFSVFVGTIIYPLFANWTWGGGWLSQLGVNLGLGHGHVDFAGSSVVHMTGGVIALVGAWLIGARRGKYNADGTPNAIPGHNIPMALAGTFILCFGWFGFNPGSTLAGSDLRIGVIATNTMVAGVLVCVAVFFIDGKLRIDDPVGAISVHGVNGLWGILSVGLLADGTYGDGWNGVPGAVRGLFYGDASQLVAQLVGGLTNFVAVGAMAYAAYKVTELVVGGHRVSAEVEELGLDLPEMGALAYPDTPEVCSAVILSESAAVSLGAGQLEPEPEAI